MKRLILVLLIILNCREGIPYRINTEVVFKPTVLIVEVTKGLYYDADRTAEYKMAVLDLENKQYFVEGGIQENKVFLKFDKSLNREIKERLKNGKR